MILQGGADGSDSSSDTLGDMAATDGPSAASQSAEIVVCTMCRTTSDKDLDSSQMLIDITAFSLSIYIQIFAVELE